MDNCFEAARILGIRRVVYVSSIAVYGPQRLYGERVVSEDDPRLGTRLYAVSKIFNEHQADWYNRAYDMAITGVRPANITGPDKVRGSTNHVLCQVLPARIEPVHFPYRDTSMATSDRSADLSRSTPSCTEAKGRSWCSSGTTVAPGLRASATASRPTRKFAVQSPLAYHALL